MVERPIKKSERQAVTESTASNDVVEVVKEAPAEPSTDEGAQNPITQSSEQRIISRPLIVKDKQVVKDKQKGKDRGDRRKDEQADKPPASLALMRGPKPTKPKSPVVVKASPEATDEDATEQEET